MRNYVATMISLRYDSIQKRLLQSTQNKRDNQLNAYTVVGQPLERIVLETTLHPIKRLIAVSRFWFEHFNQFPAPHHHHDTLAEMVSHSSSSAFPTPKKKRRNVYLSTCCSFFNVVSAILSFAIDACLSGGSSIQTLTRGKSDQLSTWTSVCSMWRSNDEVHLL